MPENHHPEFPGKEYLISSALTPPATITFDCYGTLLDTSPFHELLAKTAVKAGIQPDLAVEAFTTWEDRLMYGDPYQDYDRLLQEVLGWCDRQLNTTVFSPLLEQVLETHRHFRPFPDVIPALRKLKEAGFRICLMSNTTADLMDSHLQTLAQLPDAWLTADSTECFKPDLRFSARLKRHLNSAGIRISMWQKGIGGISFPLPDSAGIGSGSTAVQSLHPAGRKNQSR